MKNLKMRWNELVGVGLLVSFGAVTSFAAEQSSRGEESPTMAQNLAESRAYYDDALRAFKNQQYPKAVRLAAHAMVDAPRDKKVHELLSLALFALKDYQAAAREAHAALALGPAADWATLFTYYPDLPTYEKQWDALKQFRKEHPDALAATFMAAYHNLMQGHEDQAKGLLTQIVEKVPKDQVAVDLLKQLGGTTEGGDDSSSRTATKPKRED